MSFSRKVAELIKDFAEPKIPGDPAGRISKEQAKEYIRLLETKDGYGWNNYQAKCLREEMQKNSSKPLDINDLYNKSKYNFPDNAFVYVPALLIFVLFFSILYYVMW